MDIVELRKLDKDGLKKRLESNLIELSSLKYDFITGKKLSLKEIKGLKKEVAQINTLMNETLSDSSDKK